MIIFHKGTGGEKGGSRRRGKKRKHKHNVSVSVSIVSYIVQGKQGSRKKEEKKREKKKKQEALNSNAHT